VDSGADASGRGDDAPVVFPTTALVVSLWCWFVLSLGLALFETVVVPLATDHLGWSVSKNGILLTASLTVGVVAMAIVSIAGADKERTVCACGFLVMSGASALMMMSAITDSLDVLHFVTAVVLFIGVGFCSCQPALPSAYSMALQKHVPSSSIMMGWLGSAGSAGRMVGPIIATQLLSFAGVAALFGSAACLYAMTTVVILASWDKLVPSTDPAPRRRDTLGAHFAHRTSYGSADDAISLIQRTRIASLALERAESGSVSQDETEGGSRDAGGHKVVGGEGGGTDADADADVDANGGGGVGMEDGPASSNTEGQRSSSPTRRRSLVESVHMKNVPSFPTPLSVPSIKHRDMSFDDEFFEGALLEKSAGSSGDLSVDSNDLSEDSNDSPR